MAEIKSKHVLLLLLLYWMAWLYTELSEKWERDAFKQEVDVFMHKGGRFTNEDGAALEARIRELEEKK